MSSRSDFSSSASSERTRAVRLARVVLVEEIGRLDQLRLRVGPVGVQDAVLHVAFGRDDDQQHAPLGQAQELDVPEARLAPLGRHHDAGEMRQLRQQRRGRAHELLRPVGGELALEPMDLDLLERLHHHQAVDEEAVALGGRDAAGRGVRARDVAHLLEVGHHVADRRRRQLEARTASTARASRPAAPRRCSARRGSSADVGRGDPACGHFTGMRRRAAAGGPRVGQHVGRLRSRTRARPRRSSIGSALAPAAPVL